MWLLKHGGIFTTVNPSDWIRHWRHPNHLMLAVPWPGFFGLIAAGYLLLNLLFALLYWIDPHGIAGVAGETTSIIEAFFFSVQTLGSIGYGAFHPTSLFTHLIDDHSPLQGRTPLELATSEAEILISFSGIDETLERPIYAHHNFTASQTLFGQDFVDMMQEEAGQGQCFDFANFNRTHHCPAADPA